ncbi:hypothetical protein GYA13_03925 [Candidatus Kuenenbacteria bacterium]|nr:hypothetical protein [Candidatus Kuenenbacteria bacterium]
MATKIKPVSDEVVLAVKKLIAASPSGTIFGKKCLFYLIDQTQNFSRMVFMSSPVKSPKDGPKDVMLARQMIYAVHDIKKIVGPLVKRKNPMRFDSFWGHDNKNRPTIYVAPGRHEWYKYQGQMVEINFDPAVIQKKVILSHFK